MGLGFRPLFRVLKLKGSPGKKVKLCLEEAWSLHVRLEKSIVIGVLKILQTSSEMKDTEDFPF